MNRKILDKAVQDYISSHLNADVNQIALSKSPFADVSSAELANQISAKKKSQKKLPTWFNTDGIYYPPTLSIEQTSSEITAKYKSGLVEGENLIDLTGGFGVDSYYFSKTVSQVTHCEINVELSEIANINAKALKVKNITFEAKDGLELLKNKDSFDTIYIDPARRATKGKVFMLKDCTPNVVGNLDILLEKSNRIIIKTAPLLDLTAGLQELKFVSEIHVVSIKNECKELLWIIEKGFSKELKITAATINDETKLFSFSKSELNCSPTLAKEINNFSYLYEPDAALLKSGAFNLIGNRYNLEKLHNQTQLYVSDNKETRFPGRIFKINEILSSSDLKKQKFLVGNVVVRNYPAKAEELTKKFKIKSDDTKFLIFTKNSKEENIVINAEIIQHY
ncbi:THUMP-like domain-containing protein [Pedobacter jamesrossensis]|uniref:THUMP-like domain-containing protein n=1 Tax=Pedobacter jamesrossensis TaxID=1908238 RepID=A0ABV8NQ19_9SPHI